MIIQTPELHDWNEKNGASFKMFELNLDIFPAYCLSLFSVVNQFSVVNILSEYKNPIQRRINKVKFYFLIKN